MQKYMCSDNCRDGSIYCQTDCEVHQTIISLVEDAVFTLWKESNEDFLYDLHTLYADDDVEMEWDYTTENDLDTGDVSSWLMQHDVIMKGVDGSCHGNLQHVGNITEDLEITLRDNKEPNEIVQVAFISRGNVADTDDDSAARAHSKYSSVEQFTNCSMDSVIGGTKSGDIFNPSQAVHGECHINITTHRNISKNMECVSKSNLSPKGDPQMVDCATQTETRTCVNRMLTRLAVVPRYFYPIFIPIFQIGQ